MAHRHEDDHDHDHSHDHGDGEDHCCGPEPARKPGWTREWREIAWAAGCFGMLLTGIALDYFASRHFRDPLRLVFYLLAYLPVGWPVLRSAWRSILNGNWFSEFFLMALATVGAFAIGQYPEGVAVMLFYTTGEIFQMAAVRRARSNIKTLLDQRPEEVTVVENGRDVLRPAAGIQPGAVLRLKAGEKLGLDGVLLSESATFNTAALTGESLPEDKTRGEAVLAGMINLRQVSEIRVTAAFQDSKLSKILTLVQYASARKSPTELFISKFARIYTPVVVGLAVAIVVLPYFFTPDYVFREWLYRALIFLVISCPCALVISIPLGYFGGIGAGSRNGILFKGSNFLDVMARVRQVVLDKTGTLTQGVFRVEAVVLQPGFEEKELLGMLNALESQSTHPVASALREKMGEPDTKAFPVNKVREIPGYGLEGTVKGYKLLAGNFKLLEKNGVAFDPVPGGQAFTQTAIAVDGQYAGYVAMGDELKPDAAAAVESLQKMGIHTVLLSGDKTEVVERVARQLGIREAYGALLPEDKVARLEALKNKGGPVAFAGDGINDAPVVALADAGIAMGGLGSDATIETADIVIQNDRPSKIPVAIRIGQATKRIVWQNIGLAFGVKVLVMLLGAGGLATMWEAVFADVGVAFLAILNAIRVQRMTF